MWKKIEPYLAIDSLVAITVLIVAAISVYYKFYFPETFWSKTWIEILFYLVIVGSIPLIIDLFKSIMRRQFGVDIIAIVAIISSLATRELLAAAVVLLMLSGGKSLEKYAKGRARDSLEKLLHRAPALAHVLNDGQIKDVQVKDVKIGDKIIIKQNEIIPLDGTILEGSSTVDESIITGEPIPRDISPKDKVLSGTVNGDQILTIEVTSTYEKSSFYGIVRLVEQAEKEKAPTVRLADRYSVVFTVITFIMAGIAASFDLKLGVAVLVVATPCPLILAAPIAFIAGMSKSAKKGIIVKHGGVFEEMEKVGAFFFDKTGTLTFGFPSVKEIIVHSSHHSPQDILQYAASIEQFSNHILAQSILQKAKEDHVILVIPTDVKETVGGGVIGYINSKRYTLGKKEFLENNKIPLSDYIKNQSNSKNTLMYIAEDDEIIGTILFSDKVRENSADVIRNIHTHNNAFHSDKNPKNKKNEIETIMVTGDEASRAEEIGKAFGFTKIISKCLPEQKLSLVKEYESRGVHVAMIGDGVNDAPALASASVGIALGSHGATTSTDTADAVIMVDDIGKISDLINISHNTLKIAKQSIFVGIGLSVVAMAVASLGYLPPVYGALLQEVIDTVVILNALRALR